MKAFNKVGESQFSPSIQVSTAIDVTSIPVPESVRFDVAPGIVTFIVPRSELVLTPVVETRDSEDQEWTQVEGGTLDGYMGEVKLPPRTGELEEVRIRLCVIANVSYCGQIVTAEFSKWQLVKY